MITARFRRVALLSVAFLVGLVLVADQPRAAAAMPPPPPEQVPIDRVIANLEKKLETSPNNPQDRVLLARVHVFAYIYGLETMAEKYQWPRPAELMSAPKNRAAVRDTEAGKKHLTEAFKAYAQVTGDATYGPLAHMGRAYLLENAAADIENMPDGMTAVPSDADAKAIAAAIADLQSPAADTRAKAVAALQAQGFKAAPALLQHRADQDAGVRAAVGDLLKIVWREAAIAEYKIAFDAAKKGELEGGLGMGGVWDKVGYCASESYKRMVNARGASEDEKKVIAEMDAHTDALKQLPPPPITPIVFSLTAAQPLAQLLAPDHQVRFDLDGDGRAESHGWLQPTTALLCWDPAGHGQILSGRQLFGNATWWLPFRQGYEALDLLDDNRDGELTGAELTGLCVWIDANQNGVSDPGEVQPVVNAGIAALSCRAPDTERAGGFACPANRAGLRLTDGTVLPTYDWIAPAAEPAAAPAQPTK